MAGQHFLCQHFRLRLKYLGRAQHNGSRGFDASWAIKSSRPLTRRLVAWSVARFAWHRNLTTNGWSRSLKMEPAVSISPCRLAGYPSNFAHSPLHDRATASGLSPDAAMINSASRTRLVVFVLIALAMTLAGARFLIYERARLESLPPSQASPATASIKTASTGETEIKQWNPTMPRVPCNGPRGHDLNQGGGDDNLHESTINIRKS